MALDEELAYYEVLAELVNRARQQALAVPMDKRRTIDLGIPSLPEKKARRKPALESFFDDLESALAEAFILRLVAAFEGRAFERLSNTVGVARSTVGEHVPNSAPFGRAAEKLVRAAKDHTLHDLQGLMQSYPAADVESLRALREHRNHVAHGGRVGATSNYTDPRGVHAVLAELLAILDGV